MNHIPDFEAFCHKFNNDDVCARTLLAARWPEGFRCPSCNCSESYLITTRRLPLFECRSCHLQTSVTSGTIMHKSRTPLNKWFQALFLLANPEGINAKKLAAQIQVTYKTAWLLAHKIRHSMHQAECAELLQGVIQVSFADYGYSQFPDAKHPLIVGAEVNTSGELKHVKIMQPSPDHVISDWTRRIADVGLCEFANRYVHPVNGSPDSEYPRKRSWPLVRIVYDANKWMMRTFCGIGAKHLQAYLDEYCFRANDILRRGDSWSRLLYWCTHTPKLTYSELIRDKPVLPLPWIGIGKNKWKGKHLSLIPA